MSGDKEINKELLEMVKDLRNVSSVLRSFQRDAAVLLAHRGVMVEHDFSDTTSESSYGKRRASHSGSEAKRLKGKDANESESESGSEAEEKPKGKKSGKFQNAIPLGDAIGKHQSPFSNGEWVTYRQFSRDYVKYEPGDTVVMKTMESEVPYIGEILTVGKPKTKKDLWCSVRWYYRRPEAISKSRKPYAAFRDELFYSFHKGEVPADSILGKVQMVFMRSDVSKEEFAKALRERRKEVAKRIVGGTLTELEAKEVFGCRRVYLEHPKCIAKPIPWGPAPTQIRRGVEPWVPSKFYLDRQDLSYHVEGQDKNEVPLVEEECDRIDLP